MTIKIHLERFFLTIILLMSTMLVCGQSMTDEQVIRFVRQEVEKGEDQQSIVTKLLQKGVSPEQMRRIKKKYEAEQHQLGAINLTETSGLSNGSNRQRNRTAKERSLEATHKKNGYMLRSQSEELETGYSLQRRNELNEEIAFLDIDSLLYYQNLIGEKQKVFGRNIFNNTNLTFEPSQNIATPASYQLGAGDNVIIDIWGASQESFDYTISPDGVIVIQGVGPVQLNGLTISKANDVIKSRLSTLYADCQFNLSLGQTRSITVQVMGEVNVPGTYTLSSLSSAFNALYAARGISELGTLRNIKVYRAGKIISTIDVYDYILNGNTTCDVRLMDNDVIVVGTYETLVQIKGKVKRPMFYEMKETESVSQLLFFAGGFTGDAYTQKMRLTRKKGNERSVFTIDEFERNGFKLADADSLYVDSISLRYSNMVEVRGAVKLPGQYQLGEKISTVKDLITAADGLCEDAFLNRAVIHREQEDLSLKIVSVNLEEMMKGTLADIPLRKNDVLFIPSQQAMKGEQTIRISGEVTYPGLYQYAKYTTVEDLILQAGGLTDAASMAKVDIFRRVRHAHATEDNTILAESMTLSLNDDYSSKDSTHMLLPFDMVVVRKSPGYSEQRNVIIKGCVNFEGEYAITHQNYRLSDLIQAAGGVTTSANVKGARLMRVLTEEERIQSESSLRKAQIQMYEEALQNEKNYDVARADSLLNLKMDLGYNYPVAVNLEKALLNPNGPENLLLREGDRLIIPQYSNTVKISGEIVHPISIKYKQGEPLSYYIDRAGGYNNMGNKKGAYVIYMNGSVKKLGKRTAKNIEPGCEIVIPTKKQTKKMSTTEIMALTSGGASLASVIVALISIIK